MAHGLFLRDRYTRAAATTHDGASAHSGGCAHSRRDAGPDSHANTRCDTCPHPCPHARRNTGPDRYASAHGNTGSDGHAYSCGYAQAYASHDTNAHSAAHTYPCSNARTGTDTGPGNRVPIRDTGYC